MQTQVKKNIAPSSDNGHFVEGKDIQVVNLDIVNETFVVTGKAVLTTANHTTLEMEEDCLITCQQVFDPLKQMFQKSRD
jgi:hypothetical protein